MTPEEFTLWQINEMKKKKRKQMILVICIMIAVPIFYGIVNSESEPSNEEHYESGMTLFNEAKYSAASARLSKITPEFAKYSQAKSLLKTSDSLLNIAVKEQEATVRKEKVESLKTQLTTEIKSDIFTKGFGSNYRGDVKALQMELVVFGAWKVMIDDAEKHEDPEIKKLVKTLKGKVIALQKKEFPVLRREYAKQLKNVLWEDNIEVEIKGSRNSG